MTDALDSTGLHIDDLETRIDSLVSELRTRISPSIDAAIDSPEGQFIRIFAERTQAIAELIQAVHAAQYPDSAIGKSLDALCRLNNQFRKQATKSTVTATVDVDAGTYAIGTLVACTTVDSDARFSNSVEITTSGDYLFTAENYGIVRAASGTLTVKVSSVTGWNSITNAQDAAVGTNEETDSKLRLRRQQSVATGVASVGAIRNKLLLISGVQWASVVENITNEAVDGIPAGAIACSVYAPGVSATDIATAIYESKAAGINTHGTNSEYVSDSFGGSHLIKYFDALQVNIYISMTIEVFGDTWPGEDDAKVLFADFCSETFGVGDNISTAKLITGLMIDVGGIYDILEIAVDRVSPPEETQNLVLSYNEIGVFDPGRIEMTITYI